MFGPSANGGERLPRGVGAERLLEPRDAALHQLALLLDRQVEHALVVVAVVSDLVATAARRSRAQASGCSSVDLPGTMNVAGISCRSSRACIRGSAGPDVVVAA